MLFRLTLLGCNKSANIRERPKAKSSRQLLGRRGRGGGRA